MAPHIRDLLDPDWDAVYPIFSAMGPNRPGRGAHIATVSFMVSPAHHDQGVGRALGRHVIEWARGSASAQDKPLRGA